MAEEYGTTEVTATDILASAPLSDSLGRLYDMDGMGRVPLKKMQATLQSARQAALAAVRRMSHQDAGLSMYLEEVRRVHGEKEYRKAMRKMEKEAEEREREKQAQIAYFEAHRRAAFAGLSLAQGSEAEGGGASGSGATPMESDTGAAGGSRQGGGSGKQTSDGAGAGAGAEERVGSAGSGGGGKSGRRPSLHVARFGGGEEAEKEAWREKCSKEWAPTDYLLLYGLPGRVSTVALL